MAFTLQTDAGNVPGANAYIDAAYFKSYHKDRGNDYTAGTSEIQQAIVRASDYLDYRFAYVGERLRSTQTTEWPRNGAIDADRESVNGIPEEMKEACAEYAFLDLSGTTLMPTPTRDTSGRAVKSQTKKVGPITKTVEFAGGGSNLSLPEIPVADQRLIRRGLVVRGGKLMRS